jgi:hypothetical protein
MKAMHRLIVIAGFSTISLRRRLRSGRGLLGRREPRGIDAIAAEPLDEGAPDAWRPHHRENESGK